MSAPLGLWHDSKQLFALKPCEILWKFSFQKNNFKMHWDENGLISYYLLK